MTTTTHMAEILGDLLVLEYAGALRPTLVRAAVAVCDLELPSMRGSRRLRQELLESSVRRRLTESVIRSTPGHETLRAVRQPVPA